jgi:hypothetical protein
MLSLLMLNPSPPGPFFYTFLFPVITVEETLGQVVMLRTKKESLRTKKESIHFVSLPMFLRTSTVHAIQLLGDTQIAQATDDW